jgi:sarcosine oxidase, subunit gamma
VSLRSPLEGCGTIEGPGGLLLRDLSLALREGVRGAGARECLMASGHTLPDAPNQIVVSGGSGWVMSLSHREFWLLQPDSEASSGRPTSEAVAAGVWPLYCQHSHAWLQLAGEERAEVMAKLCGVDLSEAVFPLGNVAQTQAARMSVIVAAHQNQDGQSVFSMFVDQSLARYLWEAIEDAMGEWLE